MSKVPEEAKLTQQQKDLLLLNAQNRAVAAMAEGAEPYEVNDLVNDVADAASEKAYQQGRADAFKASLKSIEKFWKQYCNFEDHKSCLELFEELYDEVEALQRGEEKG